MKALHIKIEEAGLGNPPYVRDDGGFGLRLWSAQGLALGMDSNQDGYLVYMTKEEFWADIFREASAKVLTE